MASYKSKFSPPTRPDAQVPPFQRAPSSTSSSTSRLPARSITPTFQSQTRPPTTARLQKKKSARDNVQDQSSRNIGTQKPLVAASRAAKPRPPTSKTTTPVANGSAGMTLPRYTPQTSTSRLPKYEGFVNTRTPSLVSGSSASTIESPKSVLRRKPSSIGRQAPVARPESMSSQEDLPILNTVAGGYNDPFSETVLGISLPPPGMLSTKIHERDLVDSQHYDLDAPPRLATENLPPTPLYTLSATPSTHYSGSPSSFSHMSTPTSMSSHSPGIVATHKPSQRPRQTSPLQSRPPVTRRKADDLLDGREPRALSSVRESSTSTSSVSTIRFIETAIQREIAKNPMPAPPPSPPLTLSPPLGFNTESPVKSPPRSGPTMQVPPEFAHLVDPVQEKPLQTRVPIRPSRDGTPDISALRQQSPIIQSNMASLPAHHRRQSSGSSKLVMSGALNESATRLAMPSKIPSRNPSPNPNLVSGIPRPASRTASSRGPTPDMASDTEKKAKGKAATAPSPTTKSTSRFGFFSRRTKTEPAPSKSEKPEKKLRKGPAAGTGHEGYGKFAARGRSGSTTSGTGSVGRSASADSVHQNLERTPSSRKSSVSSQGQVDDYFLDRLTPVVIRGTGSSTEICRSPEAVGSTTSLESNLDRPTPDLRAKPADPVAKRNLAASPPTLLPSALPNSNRTTSPMKRFGLGIRRPSESEDEKKSGFYALGNRRSSRRSQLFGSKDSVKSPVDSTGSSSNIPGISHTRKRSGVQPNDTKAALPAAKAADAKSKTAAQPKLTRKWNFFQRTQVTSPTKASFAERQEANAKLPPSRSVAHYALDSVDDRIDPDVFDTIKKEAESLRKDSAGPMEPPRLLSTNRPEPKHVHSILLPSPPALPTSFSQSPRPASPQVKLKKENRVEYTSPVSPQTVPEPSFSPPSFSPEPQPGPPPQMPVQIPSGQTQIPMPPRPSRLAQVGRIPQVVSQRERKLPDQSFSRPFAPENPRPSVYIPATSAESFQVPLLAETSILTDAYPAYSGLSTPFDQATFEPVSPTEDFIRPTVEFLSFPPRRKNSEMSSNSSGFWSVYAPTAVIPHPDAPPHEDEVWGEYDDLIDDVLSPPRVSTSSSLGAPFRYGDSEKEKERENGESAVPAPLKLKSLHSASNSLSSNPATKSVHLRRSRLLSALHATSPKSTLSISDFLAAYGDQHPSVVDSVTGRLSLPSTHRSSAGSGPLKAARSSLPASVVEEHRQSTSTIFSNIERRASSRYRDSRLIEMAESHAETGTSMADLRFGALMTSKWLSFGRVLFSPVHFDLKDPAEDRILVIDGLGKDWSYYCALTYSEASVYNLGPSPGDSNTSSGPTPWSTLPNHRHIHHPSMSAPFPFPRGFFAAVVFRFPIVTSESLYRFAISECKRVLRPGGYLELSVLDIELINMGNRARRAVRGLKVQMQVAEPGVCLKPASDMIMRLLGKKGFENINRCLVGVPVAAGRLSSWGSDTSSEDQKHVTPNGTAKARLGAQQEKGKAKAEKLLAAPPPTFTDLLTTPPSPDPQVAATADANITSMVARVGRWWYSKCYESTVSPEVEYQIRPSIWADGKLLRECEKRGTGFRLLVAYAQRPNCAVRRTVSV